MAPSDACHVFLVGEAAPGRSSQHNATGLVRLDLMTSGSVRREAGPGQPALWRCRAEAVLRGILESPSLYCYRYRYRQCHTAGKNKARFGCQCTKAGDAQRCAAARCKKHAIQKRKEEPTGDNLMNQRAKQHTISYETTSRTTHYRRGRDAATGLAYKCSHAMRPRSDATDSQMQAVNATRRDHAAAR
jgi:hypothetical protein